MTIKQQKAIEKVVESGGKIPIGTAMVQAGYSPETAKTPQKLTESVAWQEAMDEYLPDVKILKAHSEALEANKVISAKIIGKDADGNTDDFIEVPDHPTRLKAVEVAYKVKKKIGPEVMQQFNFKESAQKELEEFK